MIVGGSGFIGKSFIDGFYRGIFKKNEKLMKKSTNTLIKNIRLNILKLTYKAQSAHIGGSLSIVEILAILYNETLNISPKKKKFF